MRNITLSVVFYDEQKNLPRLLSSFEKQLFPCKFINFTLLFIDNYSQDMSSQLVENWLRKNSDFIFKSKLIKRKSNHLSLARQQAIDTCETQWLVFIDGDTELDWDWVEGLHKSLENYGDEVVGVGGRSYYVPKQAWHSWVVPLSQFFPLGKSTRIGKVNHVPTNNYLVKIEAVKKAGGFKADFPRVGEDLDLNIRLKKIGSIYYSNEFSAMHYLPETQKKWFSKMYKYGWAQSVVAIGNRGGVSWMKSLPALLNITILLFIFTFPTTTLLTLIFSLFFPRLRFYLMTIMAYGTGEIAGAFERGIVTPTKKILKRNVAYPHST